jgi:hypothetical protein
VIGEQAAADAVILDRFVHKVYKRKLDLDEEKKVITLTALLCFESTAGLNGCPAGFLWNERSDQHTESTK